MYPLIRRYAPLLLFWVCSVAVAQQRDAIELVEIRDTAAGPEIRIDLGVPMQYLNHVPSARGDQLLVRLRPVATGSGVGADLTSRQEYPWTPTARVPLSGVQFERLDPNTAQVVLTFRRQVSFSLPERKDFRGLRVLLAEPSPPVTTQSAYAVNLISSTKPFDAATLQRVRALTDQTVYVTQFTRNGRRWYRLRVGFYPDRARAEQGRHRLNSQFPEAWTAPVTPEEMARASATAGVFASEQPESADDATEASVGELMAQARRAMIASNYPEAIALYSRVLAFPGHSRQREALELLGLARERNGQLAQAKAVYESYLKRYPEGEEAERVRQRLVTLITASLPARDKLREPEARTAEGGWETYGSLSQYYWRDSFQVDSEPADTTQSAITTDFDLVARRRGDGADLRARITAGDYRDLLSDGPGDASYVSSAYVERNGRDSDLWFRLGRQTSSSDGVLGRFDGAKVGYRVADGLRVNAVAGYPVAWSRDGVDTDRQFIGVSADLGPYNEAWEVGLFAIEQRNLGRVDRRGVGAETRYFRNDLSVLGYLDYDIFYDALNTALLLATWTLADETTLNATLDVRKTPVLTTGNALQGQTASDLDELGQQFSDSEIYDLALDRTATSRSFTLGVSRPLNPRLRLNADATVSRISATEESGGVPAIPATGDDHFYNLQLVATDLLTTGDISSFGVRYSDAGSASTRGVYADSRYPVNDAWWVRPRLRADQRGYDNGDSQWAYAVGLRTEYRWRRNVTFELDLTGEWIDREWVDERERTTGYYGLLGYRYEF